MQEIKKYNLEQLDAFVNSKEFRTTKVLPISLPRFLSYKANPRANKEDVVMYLAYESERIIGYRLVLPDFICIDDAQEKMGWFSCIYVLPEKRSTGIAKKLTNEALKDWDGKIAFNDPVAASKNLYISTEKFCRYETEQGFKGYIRFSFSKIWKSRGNSSFVGHVIRLTDIALNIFNRLRLHKWRYYINKRNHLKFEYVTEVDKELSDFIDAHNQNEWFRRSGRDLNWVIKYPWVLETPEDDADAKRYHFSSQFREFKTLNVKLFSTDNELIGFLMISLKDGVLKVPYAYFSEQDIESIYQLVLRHIIRLKADTITIFEKRLSNYFISHKNPFWLIRKKTRPLFISKSIFDKMKNKHNIFQDGDGDSVFT